MSKRSFMPKMKGVIYKLIFILVLAAIIYFAYSFMRMKEGFQPSLTPSNDTNTVVRNEFTELMKSSKNPLDFTNRSITEQVQNLAKKLHIKLTPKLNSTLTTPLYSCGAKVGLSIECIPPPIQFQKKQGINLPYITYTFTKNPKTKDDNTKGKLTLS